MKSLPLSAIFLLVLFIAAGKESKMASAIGNCDVLGHGGGCKMNECFNGCRTKYGQAAHGFCYTINSPDDTCVCRHPC